MKSASLLLFFIIHLSMVFGFSPLAFFVLSVLALSLVVTWGVAECRRFDPVSVAILMVLAVSSAALPWLAGRTAAAGEAHYTLRLKVEGRLLEGRPAHYSDQRVCLLGRDGRLWQFAPSVASDYRKTSPVFSPYSQGELRARLMREFGKHFEVSGTGHYLVVHPRGQRDKWAMRFEQLYRSFVHYFTARRLKPRRPEFPLVAVVFPTYREFQSYAARHGAPPPRGVLGYYSPKSNRILLYDITSQTGNAKHWSINAGTIIHEAAHQSAFNTGIHSRFHMPPRWVAEGLGTMFEASGVWDSQNHRQQRDRVNRARLARFLRWVPRRPAGYLSEFVSGDRLFRSDPDAAYGEAWALTFYLVETRPRQYAGYLQATARGQGGMRARGPDRLQVFLKHFGPDLRMLEAHYLRYLAELPRKLNLK